MQTASSHSATPQRLATYSFSDGKAVETYGDSSNTDTMTCAITDDMSTTNADLPS